MNRRDFIKAASGGALLLGNTSVSHAAAENRPPIPGALGMLYDSTLCVGCRGVCDQMPWISISRRNRKGADVVQQ